MVQVKAEYTLGQWAVGISWLGQWTFGAFLFLSFHYPPQPTLGRFLLSSPMDRQQHHCLDFFDVNSLIFFQFRSTLKKSDLDFTLVPYKKKN